MNQLQLASRLEALSEYSGRAIAWLTLVMVLLTFAIVVLRYVFHMGWIGMQEAVLYLHSLVFLIGAAYTLKHDGHVRVDIFYRELGPRGQAWVDLLGTLLLLVPTCAFFLWVGWDYVLSSWQVREASRETGGLPGVYVLKSLMLVMAALLLLQGLAAGWRASIRLRQRLPGPALPTSGEDGGP